MSSSEWPSVDAHNVSLPAIVSSSDLFDGELFGDELMDIYTSSVVDYQAVEDSLDENNSTHAVVSAIADGLGEFRSSASFGDLTSLLAHSVDVSIPAVTSVMAATPVVVAPENEPSKGSKKRSVSGGSTPPNKKKTTSVKGRRRGTGPAKGAATNTSNESPEAYTPLVVEKTESPALSSKETTLPDPLSSGEETSPTVSGATVDCSTGTDNASQPSDDEDDEEESDEDFKSIAQAAVASLMNGTGNEISDCSGSLSSDEKIDTSTAHIKALTSNNWVAACSGGASVTGPTIASTNDKGTNRTRKQNLSADERARQNRDRNREHARNTRLRKKAYVEELKRTLTELVVQRDASELERRQSAQRELEQREVRYRVLEEFLKLRGRNETNVTRWAAILEDGFTLTLPVPRYQQMTLCFGAQGFDHVLHGVSEVMADSNSLADYLQTIRTDDSRSMVTFDFNCDRQDFFMDGCNASLDWTGTTTGAKVNMNGSELTIKGLVRAKFSLASNKLLAATLSYDTGAIFSQVVCKLKKSPMDELDAAQAAAHQADAFLDSLQMPRLAASFPSAVTVVHPSSSSSEGSSDKGELDSDESICEGAVDKNN